jgi:hypothetical protein
LVHGSNGEDDDEKKFASLMADQNIEILHGRGIKFFCFRNLGI